ncbi:transglutaminase-like domain-containing protein [Demequina aurantiaca]|uniref:transglutaminase-like domain-containing protein n=1 Tax=Demequina aurantiaca TaxID=676200 RepID=UPI0007816B73|nr:transglutaminase family protein [Demequina aurantiaca]
MNRDVNSELVLDVTSTADIVLSVACADVELSGGSEELIVELDGESLPTLELQDRHSTRLHRLTTGPGELKIRYSANIPRRVEPESVDEADIIRYLRPSRYCESDSLGPTAFATFADLSGSQLLEAVGSWVGTKLFYVSGSSLPTDGAVRTLLAREGVCRDFAHLCIGLLRAMNVPARLASVYAPGLSPMDFHAVCEAHVDGRWLVVDPTTLAPRSSMVRIATGRDAADTAFLTVLSGTLDLESLSVTAVVDDLPYDDVREAVQLG